MHDFNGKLALITGGGGSIGQALTRALSEAGARVAVADVSLERAQVSASTAANAEAFQVDVTDRVSLARMITEVHDRMGTVELACVNAGVSLPGGDVTERSDDDWHFMMNINLMGAVRTVDAVLPDLRENRPGSYLLLTTSIAGLMVRGHLPLNIYSVSKFAAVGYGQELRAQFAREGIGISMLLPGLVPSAMVTYSQALRDGQSAGHIDVSNLDGPEELKQFAVSPEDCARVALDGVRDNRFFISTHADAAERLREHYASVVAELSVGGVEPGLD